MAVLGLAAGGEGDAGLDDGASRHTVVTAAKLEARTGYERTQRFIGRVEFAQASALAFELRRC